MKQTENYQLTQWEKSDRIQMEDFNRDNAALDAALTAQAAELAAVQAALTKCGNCRIWMGGYTGTGTYAETGDPTFTFPQMPVVFIIKGPRSSLLIAQGGESSGFAILYGSFSSDSYATDRKLTWNGNQVTIEGKNNALESFNGKDRDYWVMALFAADQEAE